MARQNHGSNATLKRLQEEVKQVYKTLYQGNGKPSLVTQLSDLEGKLKSHNENIEEQISNLEKEMELKFKHIAEIVTERLNSISVQITSEFGRKRAESNNLFNFRTAITTSILASATSIIVLLLTEFFKHFHG